MVSGPVSVNEAEERMASMQTPRVSLLVPVYNVERYLEQCLDSALSQTLSDIEVICVNDGSTDSSPEILRAYAARDERIRIINKENSGYGASMNRGLDEACGTYIGILESDDFFEPYALEHLVSAAEGASADMAKADFWFYWSVPSERRERGQVVSADIAGAYCPLDKPDIFYQKPSIWSAVYKREFLLQHSVRFLETPGAAYQDCSFSFKTLALAKRAVFLDEPVLSYRQDNEASSVNSPGKVYCVCDEYAEIERFLCEHPDLRGRLEGIKSRMKYDSYMWNYERLAPELGTKFLERASEEFAYDLEQGNIDFSLFPAWTEADLHALIRDPKGFGAAHDELMKPGKLNTFKHYYRLGGMRLVAKVLAEKSGGRA